MGAAWVKIFSLYFRPLPYCCHVCASSIFMVLCSNSRDNQCPSHQEIHPKPRPPAGTGCQPSLRRGGSPRDLQLLKL